MVLPLMTSTTPSLCKFVPGCHPRTEKVLICCCRMPTVPAKPVSGSVSMAPCRTRDGVVLGALIRKRVDSRACKVRASAVDGSSNFAKRIEQAWLISQQPMPVECSTCNSKGNSECKWCGGTGFFILGDNMLCQVPSKNTSCVICAGKGSMQCSDCQGTGFRAKWLVEPPPSSK